MENTLRKIISDILTSVKAETLDDRISRRFVLSKLQNKGSNFMKQDADARRLFRISEGWKRIPTIEMMETDLMEGGLDVAHCSHVMRSRRKIPEVFQTSYGNILKVFTINFQKELKQTTFHEYKEIARREVKNPHVIYFILSEGYIFVPDSDIEELSAIGLFKNPYDVTKFLDPSTCASPLDEVAPFPDYLVDIIITDVTKELAEVYRRLPADEKSNLNNNEK